MCGSLPGPLGGGANQLFKTDGNNYHDRFGCARLGHILYPTGAGETHHLPLPSMHVRVVRSGPVRHPDASRPRALSRAIRPGRLSKPRFPPCLPAPHPRRNKGRAMTGFGFPKPGTHRLIPDASRCLFRRAHPSSMPLPASPALAAPDPVADLRGLGMSDRPPSPAIRT